MGRKSKYYRDSVRVTAEWIESFCLPRITDRDRRILQFVAENRIATIHQIAKVEFSRGKDPHYLARRRIRTLYELHCLDRFFPLVESGSAPQHLVLDSAGARILGIESYSFIRSLPVSYRHMVFLTESRMKLGRLGRSLREHRIGPGVVSDLYFPEYGVCVEVDMGTETRSVLESKLSKYRRLRSLSWLLFVTHGSQKRVDFVINQMRNKAPFRTIGVRWPDLSESIGYILRGRRNRAL